MPIGIYPPTLLSTQTAFLASTTEYPIYFTLQQITAFSDIGHALIRIVKQSNNRTIVDTSLYPDGVIYRTPSEIKVSGSKYYVTIQAKTDLAETWKAGYLYKVQMRFGSTEKYSSLGEFAEWKQEQVENLTFSEWSNVMIIKAINSPTVEISNAESVREDVISTEHTESTLTPLFTGSYTIDSSSNELLDKYKFSLYSGLEVTESALIETSGWLQHDGSVNTVDTHRFKTRLENEEYYTVTYEIETVNGYTVSADPYVFLAVETHLEDLTGMTLTIDDDDIYCQENGCARIYLSTDENISGCYVITRTSEASDYNVWEDLAYFVYSNQSFNNTLIYQDFTIESGIKYKYAIQLENSAELRSSPLYEDGNNYKMVDFEYSYLYRDGVQLRLMFNQKLSSFKHTVLESKQDTLGDKFPHLVRNGNAYYAEFPISGLISFQMDEDLTFFTLGSDGYYYDGELVIPKDKFSKYGDREGDNPSYTINSNLTRDNVFVERKFREKVEEFLNNFEYKLYKSPTEGNIIVGLLNVSMTPNASLGRMIYEFSATAYEVMENTLENLDEIGIIDIGEFDTLSSDEISLSFGQIAGLYTGGDVSTNIYEQIKEQEEISVGGGYKMQLENIKALWIEGYPVTDFKEELTELQAEKSELETAGEDTTEVDEKIASYEALAQALQGPTGTTTVISINGTPILVSPNKVYSLREPVTTLEVVSAVSPIIVNYVCELTQQQDTSVGVVSSIDASRIWGLVYGVFTGTDKVLKNYNYNYGPGEQPYRVYSNSSELYVILDDKLGRIVIDNTTYNVYKTTNLYEIIKEETRKQVEYIYDIDEGFTLNEDGEWTDGTIYYSFTNMILFDIEADPGTKLYIGKSEDGSDAAEVILGPTGRYTLNPMESLVKYIALSEGQFAIINYKCLTTQMKKTTKGE